MKNIIDKLVSRGAAELSDSELLVVLAEDKPVGEALFAECGSLSALAAHETARLRMMQGLGLGRALRFAAAAEFGRRVAAEKAKQNRYVKSYEDVVTLFRPMLFGLKHEECWVVYLSSSNWMLETPQLVSRGGVQSTIVDHRLVVKRALELLATQLILVHNHPSGTAEPSPQDKALTEKIASAAALFDIRLLDHVIIARSGHFSFMQAKLLK